MADEPTLLVPGTQATSLVDQTGHTVFNPVRVKVLLGRGDIGDRDAEQLGKLLSMEHVPGRLKPVKNSLEDGTFVTKGEVVRAPYDGLPVSIWWRYDWRADLRYNALKLLDTLQHEAFDGTRWNLIGHSQGGLVILIASKLAGSPKKFASMVGRVVLVGCPVAGTVRAVEAVLFGRKDLGEENVPGLMAAARTWPALYQMFPAWDASVDKDGKPRPKEKQFNQPKGWGKLMEADDPIQEDLLTRVREAQALLTGPFSHLSSVDTLTIMGRRQNTPISVPMRGGKYVQDYKNQKGDSLVPEALTSKHLGEPVHDRRKIFEGKVNDHSLLCVDPDVQSLIGKFFKQPLIPLPAV